MMMKRVLLYIAHGESPHVAVNQWRFFWAAAGIMWGDVFQVDTLEWELLCDDTDQSEPQDRAPRQRSSGTRHSTDQTQQTSKGGGVCDIHIRSFYAI